MAHADSTSEEELDWEPVLWGWGLESRGWPLESGAWGAQAGLLELGGSLETGAPSQLSASTPLNQGQAGRRPRALPSCSPKGRAACLPEAAGEELTSPEGWRAQHSPTRKALTPPGQNWGAFSDTPH